MKKLVEVYPNVRDLLKVLLDSDVLEARLKSYVRDFESDCLKEIEGKLDGCEIVYKRFPRGGVAGASVVVTDPYKFVESLTNIDSLVYIPSDLHAAIHKLHSAATKDGKSAYYAAIDMVSKLLSELISNFAIGIEDLVSKIGADRDVNGYLLQFLSLKGKNLFDDVMVDENGFIVIP